MHKICSRALSVGLVNIPCGVYRATDPPNPEVAHLLHATDSVRLEQRLWCPADACFVPRADAIHGYPVGPNGYVILAEEDVASLPVPARETIPLEQIVHAGDARSLLRYPRDTYFLAPEPLGTAAYGLLRDALAADGLIAIGTVALRERERLAAVEPCGEVLILTTIAWPSEIRSPTGLELPPIGTAPARQRKLAAQLVAMLAGSFDPAALEDRYAVALGALIAERAAGSPALPAGSAVAAPALTDLMAALEASVEAARRTRSEAPEPADIPRRRGRGRAQRTAA